MVRRPSGKRLFPREPWMRKAVDDYMDGPVPDSKPGLADPPHCMLDAIARAYAEREVPKSGELEQAFAEHMAEFIGVDKADAEAWDGAVARIKREAEAWTGINDFSRQAGQPGEEAQELAKRCVSGTVSLSAAGFDQIHDRIVYEVQPLVEDREDYKRYLTMANATNKRRGKHIDCLKSQRDRWKIAHEELLEDHRRVEAERDGLAERVRALEGVCDGMAARRPVTNEEIEKWSTVAKQAQDRIANLETENQRLRQAGYPPGQGPSCLLDGTVEEEGS